MIQNQLIQILFPIFSIFQLNSLWLTPKSLLYSQSHLSLPLYLFSSLFQFNITGVQGLHCHRSTCVWRELGSGRNSESKDKIIVNR